MVLISSSSEGSYIAGGTVQEAGWRTMLGACHPPGGKRTPQRTVKEDELLYATWWLYLRETVQAYTLPSQLAGINKELRRLFQELEIHIMRMNAGRRPFWTRKG